MIIILFGKPGVGKNFVGDVMAKNFGFYHYDADSDLPKYVVDKIKSGQLATDEDREKFYDIVIDNIKKLKKSFKNIVVSQALIKEKHRKMLLEKLPSIKFLWLQADKDIMAKRLLDREHFVSKNYADELDNLFEQPKIVCDIIKNNSTEEAIINQLESILQK